MHDWHKNGASVEGDIMLDQESQTFKKHYDQVSKKYNKERKEMNQEQ